MLVTLMHTKNFGSCWSTLLQRCECEKQVLRGAVHTETGFGWGDAVGGTGVKQPLSRVFVILVRERKNMHLPGSASQQRDFQ